MSSLYLHIPFCRSKCPYCDFFSQVGSQEQVSEYVDLLLQHLHIEQRISPSGSPLETIFFGGGTPSLLSAEQVARLLTQLETAFGFSGDCEISLEANPGTLDQGKLRGYRSAGINRLSLGVQSLSARQLQQLGRIHSVDDARSSAIMARRAGFENLSFDLMFSLPGQSMTELKESLQELLALQPQHLSLYGLTFEPGTVMTARLQRGELEEVADEEYVAQYRHLHTRLAEAEFEHYEISNFARPGYRCRHNQVYWQRQECQALGCGAHSFLAAGWGERRHVPPDLAGYRKLLLADKDPSKRLEIFDCREAMVETIYLALRTADGLSRIDFRAVFGQFPEELFPEAFACSSEYLKRQGDRWRFTLEGWLIYDHLISRFL